MAAENTENLLSKPTPRSTETTHTLGAVSPRVEVGPARLDPSVTGLFGVEGERIMDTILGRPDSATHRRLVTAYGGEWRRFGETSEERMQGFVGRYVLERAEEAPFGFGVEARRRTGLRLNFTVTTGNTVLIAQEKLDQLKFGDNKPVDLSYTLSIPQRFGVDRSYILASNFLGIQGYGLGSNPEVPFGVQEGSDGKAVPTFQFEEIMDGKNAGFDYERFNQTPNGKHTVDEDQKNTGLMFPNAVWPERPDSNWGNLFTGESHHPTDQEENSSLDKILNDDAASRAQFRQFLEKYGMFNDDPIVEDPLRFEMPKSLFPINDSALERYRQIQERISPDRMQRLIDELGKLRAPGRGRFYIEEVPYEIVPDPKNVEDSDSDKPKES